MNENREISRPGVSAEFLRGQNIRRVDVEEAASLLGFGLDKNASGIWIPYYSPFTAGPLIVNGRPFGRLRLNNPRRDSAKYLSPKDSGAQLYVPLKSGPFGNELVVCEGEFKALALCEAGIRAVGIGGICSAISESKLIPDLQKVFAKWPQLKTVYFLGDADTALKFAFSREAVKIARVLPADCTLNLPRIPLSMPNGIDDVRAALGDERFLEFWREISLASVTVDPKITASALAAKLAKRELSNIAALSNNEHQICKLSELASFLDPLSLESLASAVKEVLDFSIAAFRDAAKQFADERKLQLPRKRESIPGNLTT